MNRKWSRCFGRGDGESVAAATRTFAAIFAIDEEEEDSPITACSTLSTLERRRALLAECDRLCDERKIVIEVIERLTVEHYWRSFAAHARAGTTCSVQ